MADEYGDSLEFDINSDEQDEDSGGMFADFDNTEENDSDYTEDEAETPVYNENTFKSSKSSMTLGYKTVGVILLIAMIILAGIFVFFDRISVKPKVKEEPQVTQNAVENENPTSTDAQPITQPVEQDGGMTALPADIAIDYTGEVYQTSGQVHNKLKYLEGSQVIYCVQVNAKIGESNKLVNYYCGYNVFNSVTEGDTVSLTYQVVSNTCYSVNTISK